MGPEQEQTRFAIVPLGDQHNRAAFSCGVEALDFYLHRQAGQDKRAAVAFVATADGKTVAGHYTLSQYAIQLDAVPEEIAKKVPNYPMVPTTLVGRLAVSTEFRRQRLGELLLMDALQRSLVLSEQAASAGVIVDAKDESALSFYKKYGFLDLPQSGAAAISSHGNGCATFSIKTFFSSVSSSRSAPTLLIYGSVPEFVACLEEM